MSTTNNQATAKQAAFCESLAERVGKETFEAAFAKAANWNGNAPKGNSETVTRAVRRLTKTAASKLIGELLEATK